MKCFQHDANKTIPVSLYEHVNLLEHLGGNAFIDTNSVSRDSVIDG